MSKRTCPTCGGHKIFHSTPILFSCENPECRQEWFVDCQIIAVTPIEKQAYQNEKARCIAAGSPPHSKWDCAAEFQKDLQALIAEGWVPA